MEAAEQKDVSGLTIAAGDVTCLAKGCEVRNPDPTHCGAGAASTATGDLVCYGS